ncbi:hypothetical protein SAMN05443248_0509 [Bradyrhizobium erythrophlei]|jgi:hypothetical protein|uniref:Uncharacterized protein n=1 Tax=Bradyrhizobium erythrophlei TaxID=1437360 RepID=A0A1M5HJZ3_9BRAD|nr:hypothetical protein SAMN05443248_0509 [Bradyrhizobium erythrophlei]
MVGYPVVDGATQSGIVGHPIAWVRAPRRMNVAKATK